MEGARCGGRKACLRDEAREAVLWLVSDAFIRLSLVVRGTPIPPVSGIDPHGGFRFDNGQALTHIRPRSLRTDFVMSRSAPFNLRLGFMVALALAGLECMGSCYAVVQRPR